jgi:N,N'-diacetyllegionaminate synthase
MKIGDKDIGGAGSTYIIADVGSNFNGSLELAKEYIQAGRDIGVDCVKFQTYTAESLLSPIKPNGHRWEAYDVVKRYELPLSWHPELIECAKKCGVEFLTTPFSLEIIDALNEMGISAFKVASGDLTFIPLLKKIGSCGKPIILSTGMAYIGEIETAIKRLRQSGSGDIALLHCVSNYPPKYEKVNLKAVKTMRQTFSVPVGLSDHTLDDVTALGAVALGACIVEKHITVDKNLGPPDAPFAMTIDEFKIMIDRIRNLEQALGNGTKEPADDELGERQWARRGIYASRVIEVGEKLTLENAKFLRPSWGISALEWMTCQESTVKRNIASGEPVMREDI